MLSSRKLLVLAATLTFGLTGCGSDDNSPAGSNTVPEAPAPTPAPESGGLVDYPGRIQAVGTASVTVDGRSFSVNAETVITRQGSALALSDLQVGATVLVKARTNSQGELIAAQISVREDASSEVRFTGTVNAVNAPDLQVGNRLVHTDASTRFTGIGNPQSLADIPLGSTVTVTGTKKSDNTYDASKIKIE